MANRTLFQSYRGTRIPRANAVNEAGGAAYALAPKEALAQYAVTGCLNHTFYADADTQLQAVIALAYEVDAQFVAKTALYCRTRGFMKDMPALLCATLTFSDAALLARVFDRVIDDGKMLRNFVQIVRSGVVGRKSLGTAPKRLVRRWLDARDERALFNASVGQSPSLADVIKMVHPKPRTPAREALYGYLLGRESNVTLLPESVQAFEAFKLSPTGAVPEVPFQMLTALALTSQHWMGIAETASWQTTRMNLNTFARHGVFTRPALTRLIADRLRNREAIARAKAFPYQLMVAFMNAGDDVPFAVKEALQDAMEVAIENVPTLNGVVYVLPDVSGSMASPVTGVRNGATSAVRCIDVAALVAAAVLRKNPHARVIPFAETVRHVKLNARDSVMTNAQTLARLNGGGTNCSAPLAQLNQRNAEGDVVIYVSDNQSWMDAQNGNGATATMREWAAFKERNPKAKLVCIDVQPYANTQADERADVMNVGGFSDQVFDAVGAFVTAEKSRRWVDLIEEVTL